MSPRVALAFALLLAPALAAAAERTEVAEASVRVEGSTRRLGTAFFLRAPGEQGVVAVVGSPSLDLPTVVRAGEVTFRAGEDRLLGVSRRFYAVPRSGADGAGFAVFALDDPPEDVRVLEPETRNPPRVGDEVRVLGGGASMAGEQAARVVRVEPHRIEVVTEGLADVLGWEGAPVLSGRKRRVIGVLQGSSPEAPDALHLRVTPIQHVIWAAQRPVRLAGRPFPTGVPFGELARRRVDVLVVLDTSVSTNDGSGADLNRNGVVGRRQPWHVFGSSDPEDSILHAEVAAARRILQRLDPAAARIGLVTFASARGPVRSAALTQQELTSEFGRVEEALTHLLARGGDGATHIAAGTDQATVELLGLAGALSTPDPLSDKVVFFLTDGRPTRPFGAAYSVENVAAVARAAERAARGGVRVHAFALGPGAVEEPRPAEVLGVETGGRFAPVPDVGHLLEQIDVSLAAEALLPSVAETNGSL